MSPDYTALANQVIAAKVTYHEALDQFRRALIVQAKERHHTWFAVKRALKLPHSSLHYRRKELEIN